MAAKKLRFRKDGKRSIPIEDALWQYILDHARPFRDGGYSAIFLIKSRAAFESSVRARQRGLYRYTEDEIKTHRVVGVKKIRKKGWRKYAARYLQKLINLL